MDQANAESRANEINFMLDSFFVAIPVIINGEWIVIVKSMSELPPNYQTP